jgi:hypothetical protein
MGVGGGKIKRRLCLDAQYHCHEQDTKMVFGPIVAVVRVLWAIFKILAHAITWTATFLLNRLFFIIFIFSILTIAEQQVVLLNAVGVISDVITSIIPDLSFINDLFECIDGVRLLWNTFIDVIQALFFVISAAAGSPISPFNPTRGMGSAHVAFQTNFHAFETQNQTTFAHFAYQNQTHFYQRNEIVFGKRGLVDFCASFIPMRDFMIDVVNIFFGGLRDFLNELFIVFPDFPDLRSRIERGTWRVVDASGAFFDKRFSVGDAIKVFVEAIMQAFVDIFDPRFCFHPIEEFPSTLWGCLGCGFNRTQAGASITAQINAPFVCLCGGSLDDNTVILVIKCIGMDGLLTIYNNILSQKDVFDQTMNSFVVIKDAAVALWNFVSSLFNTAKEDVKTITRRFCSLDPTGLTCRVLGLRDGNLLCAFDLRSGTETLLFCLDMDMPDMPKMPESLIDAMLYTEKHPSKPLFSSTMYLEQPPAVPINPSFIPKDDGYAADSSPRYTLRDIVDNRPTWMDHSVAFINAMVDTAFETIRRGDSPGVPYVTQALSRHHFDANEMRSGMRDLVRHVGMRPAGCDATRNVCGVSSMPYETQERFVEFFGIGIAFSVLFVGIITVLLPALLPCVILTLLALMLVMLIALPAIAELAGNTLANFVSGSLTTYDPFSFLIYICKGLFFTAFTRDLTPSEVGATLSTLSSAVGTTLDMFAIYVFKSGVGVFMAPFGNGNSMPPPLYDTSTGEPLDTFLSYFNGIINCVPTDQCFSAADCFNGGCNCVNGTLARGQSLCNEPGTCYCAPRLRKGTFSFPQFSIRFDNIDPTKFGYVVHGVMWPFEWEWWRLPFRWMSSLWNGWAPFLARVLVYNLHLGSLGIIMPCCACVCKCCKRQIGWLTKLSYIAMPLGLGIGLLVEPVVDHCEFRSIFYCTPVQHFLLPRDVQSVEYILAALNFGPCIMGAYCLYLLLQYIYIFFTIDFLGLIASYVIVFFEAAFRAPSWYIVARKSHGIK